MGCEGSASMAKKMLVADPRSISPTFFIRRCLRLANTIRRADYARHHRVTVLPGDYLQSEQSVYTVSRLWRKRF
jgi:hypothetical protein